MGRRIKFGRQRRVMTQGELALAAGVALITVNRLENDAIENPRPATVRKLAAALAVDPAWLLFGEEREQQSERFQQSESQPIGLKGALNDGGNEL